MIDLQKLRVKNKAVRHQRTVQTILFINYFLGGRRKTLSKQSKFWNQLKSQNNFYQHYSQEKALEVSEAGPAKA